MSNGINVRTMINKMVSLLRNASEEPASGMVLILYTYTLLFDLFKAFDLLESSHKSDIFIRKDLFSFMRAQIFMSYHLI